MHEATLNYPSIVEALVFQIQALKDEVRAAREFKPETKRPLLHLCKPVDPVRSERSRNSQKNALNKKRDVYFEVIDKLEELGIDFGEVCKNYDVSFDMGSRNLYKMARTANRAWLKHKEGVLPEYALLKDKEANFIFDLENLTGIRICEEK